MGCKIRLGHGDIVADHLADAGEDFAFARRRDSSHHRAVQGELGRVGGPAGRCRRQSLKMRSNASLSDMRDGLAQQEMVGTNSKRCSWRPRRSRRPTLMLRMT